MAPPWAPIDGATLGPYGAVVWRFPWRGPLLLADLATETATHGASAAARAGAASGLHVSRSPPALEPERPDRGQIYTAVDQNENNKFVLLVRPDCLHGPGHSGQRQLPSSMVYDE